MQTHSFPREFHTNNRGTGMFHYKQPIGENITGIAIKRGDVLENQESAPFKVDTNPAMKKEMIARKSSF